METFIDLASSDRQEIKLDFIADMFSYQVSSYETINIPIFLLSPCASYTSTDFMVIEKRPKAAELGSPISTARCCREDGGSRWNEEANEDVSMEFRLAKGEKSKTYKNYNFST